MPQLLNVSYCNKNLFHFQIGGHVLHPFLILKVNMTRKPMALSLYIYQMQRHVTCNSKKHSGRAVYCTGEPGLGYVTCRSAVAIPGCDGLNGYNSTMHPLPSHVNLDHCKEMCASNRVMRVTCHLVPKFNTYLQ